MAGTYRHGRTYCQVRGCRARVRQATEVDLPMAWEASAEYTALTVVVGFCRRHGHDAARRVRALLEARSELPQLLEIIDGAVTAEAELQSQLRAAETERDQLRDAVLALGDTFEHGSFRIAIWMVEHGHADAAGALLRDKPEPKQVAAESQGAGEQGDRAALEHDGTASRPWVIASSGAAPSAAPAAEEG